VAGDLDQWWNLRIGGGGLNGFGGMSNSGGDSQAAATAHDRWEAVKTGGATSEWAVGVKVASGKCQTDSQQVARLTMVACRAASRYAETHNVVSQW
jgi:hypothetical protein